MSLSTWNAEFYPIEAWEISEQNAVAHSLRKWSGLRPENMKRHGIKRSERGVIYDEDYHLFVFDDRSCALCFHHLLLDGECGFCPVAVLSGRTCDNDDDMSEYLDWYFHDDPEPMIMLLQDCLSERM